MMNMLKSLIISSIKVESNIFIDLDECLVECHQHRSEEDAKIHSLTYPEFQGITFRLGGGWEPVTWYASFRRPEALELVEYCQGLVGVENTYILTNSGFDYAHYIRHQHNLGIDSDHLFCYEDLGGKEPKFKGCNNILIDNETYDYHRRNPSRGRNKITFLHRLPKDKLLTIQPFDVLSKNNEFLPTKDWREEIQKTLKK